MSQDPEKEYQVYNSAFYADTIGLRLLFDNSNIPYRIQDENSAVTMGLESGAIGGVKIFVKQKDLERASKIMIENDYLKQEDVERTDYFDSELGNRFVSTLQKNAKLILVVGIALLIILIVFYLIDKK